ncbi:CMP-N-acetylneuraminate-poly-alpha-2,8-sialyltransferase-like [Patiria miniata]|uniref:Alpha-2,8-sialyltransferase 8B-like n=1 Tax=Patiria miniata TaxID=46514 RepID=A0A914ABZ8_PATMI|nr:CMP-N-acetylneuraminate-poly-alpha-2,8-sialyltransferase-like [Patiria miniata]
MLGMHQPARPRVGRSSFWWFTAVCLFSVLGLMASIYITEDGHVLLYNRLRLKVTDSHVYVTSASKTKPVKTVTTSLTTLLTTPTNNQTSQVTLHCKMVCSQSAGNFCVPLEFAIFVYKTDTPTDNMTFNLQNYNPVVHIARESNTSHESSVLEVERCNLEEHFPGVELIPRQPSCAVIGNSGILNNSSCGNFIDSHDFVIRANMGLIKGYEVDVGKTSSLNAFNTLLLSSYGSAMEKTKSKRKLHIRATFFDTIKTLKESILWYPKELYIGNGSFASGRNYRSVIDALRRKGFTGIRFAYSWKPVHVEKLWGLPLGGTLGLDIYTVARTFCSNITLFGFYPFHKDLEGRAVKYHYYDKRKLDFDRSKWHNFSMEHTILKELERQGKLTLVVRDCKPRK